MQISPKIKESLKAPKSLEAFRHIILEAEKDHQAKSAATTTPQPIYSRNTDREIKNIIDKLIEEHVRVWLKPLLVDSATTEIESMIKIDIWIALKRLNERLSQIDKVQLLATDLIQKITEHFARLRIHVDGIKDVNDVGCFSVPGFLLESKRETEVLAKIADILVMFLMPQSYSTCIGVKLALRTQLSNIFQVAVDEITDPANINHHLLDWLTSSGTYSKIKSEYYNAGGQSKRTHFQILQI